MQVDKIIVSPIQSNTLNIIDKKNSMPFKLWTFVKYKSDKFESKPSINIEQDVNKRVYSKCDDRKKNYSMWIGNLLGISDQVVKINGQTKTVTWLKVYYDNPDTFILCGVLKCSNWVVP